MDIYTDDDIAELVKKTHALAQENNHMLHAMRRSQRWGFFFRIVFWFIMLGAPVALYYYYLAPYAEGLRGTVEQMRLEAQKLDSAQRSLPQEAKQFFENLLRDHSQ